MGQSPLQVERGRLSRGRRHGSWSIGSPGGIRTPDPRLRRALLFPLSYRAIATYEAPDMDPRPNSGESG